MAGASRFEYELLYDGAAHAEAAHVSGLIDVEALRPLCGAQHYDAERSGSGASQSGDSRGLVGTLSGRGQEPQVTPLLEENNLLRALPVNGAEKARQRVREPVASYVPAAS